MTAIHTREKLPQMTRTDKTTKTIHKKWQSIKECFFFERKNCGRKVFEKKK
jgi:hypothetical protein